MRQNFYIAGGHCSYAFHRVIGRTRESGSDVIGLWNLHVTPLTPALRQSPQTDISPLRVCAPSTTSCCSSSPRPGLPPPHHRHCLLFMLALLRRFAITMASLPSPPTPLLPRRLRLATLNPAVPALPPCCQPMPTAAPSAGTRSLTACRAIPLYLFIYFVFVLVANRVRTEQAGTRASGAALWACAVADPAPGRGGTARNSRR